MSVIVNGKYPDENNRIQLTSQDINMSYSENISIYGKIEQLQSNVNGFNDTLGIIIGNNNYVTINDKINNIYTTKTSIATSIMNKGVKMPQTTPFERYSEYIDKIQCVTEQELPPQQQEQIKYLVRFIDYDGTVLKQESVLEGSGITAPQLPSHKNLVFFGWNNSFEKVYNDLQIGAIYNTVSNKCYFELQIQHDGDDAFISFNVEEVLSTVGGNIVINWGDSIIISENIALGQTGIFNFKHTYSSKDIYQIVVEFTNLNVSFNRNCFCDYENNLNYNYQLLSAKIGNKITKINAYAFNNCYRLKSVSLPNGIKQISNFSFQNCYMLENINFPVTLTVLGKSVFNYCKSLQKITFPNGINSIGDNCFFGCSQLQKLVLILKNKECELGQYLFGNCLQLKNVVYSVNKIPSYCFYQCYSLQNFLNLISIISIGNNSFQQCTQLKNISLYVTQIPSYCFYNCYSLQNIKINNKITRVGSNAFYNCNSLENIKFNYGVQEISESAFESCTNLKTIDLRSGLSSIGNRAFYNCDSLQKITMSYESTSLERNQFRFSESTTIGSNAFYNCMSLRDLKITCLLSDGNYGDVSIGTNCFNNCINLQSFDLKANNVTLGEGSFQNCYELSLLNIEGNFKKYENRLFYNCKNLKEITIKQSITEIGGEVFVGCYSLQTVNVQGKTPAIIVQNSYDVNNIFCIYVPNSSYSNYKKVWSYVEDKIIGNITEEEQLNIPLTFVAQEVGATVKFEKIGEYDISNFLWRRGDGIDDGIGWLPYEFGTQIPVSGVNEKGQTVESVQFCSFNSFLALSEQKYIHCVTKGKVSAFGNVLSLIDNRSITKQYCFYALFKDCVDLITMPIFKSTASAPYCCKSMFEGCTSLIQTKSFRISFISNNCFEYMFKDCTSLIQNKGVLTSSILSDYCYYGMFQGCINLKNIYNLSFDEASISCCQRMFYGCTNLLADIDLIIKSYSENSYKQMFENCKNLKINVIFSTNHLAVSCCERMFCGSGIFKTPENFSFYNFPEKCFKQMFMECQNLLNVTNLISSQQHEQTIEGMIKKYNSEFEDECCFMMFAGCKNIKNQPQIFAKTIGNYSCEAMFTGTGLQHVNNITTDSLSEHSFAYMFGSYYDIKKYDGCNLIKDIPTIKSFSNNPIQLGDYSCLGMFSGCQSLEDISYQILGLFLSTKQGCYSQMFSGCHNLTGYVNQVIDGKKEKILLPSMILSNYCYEGMFEDCYSLTETPELPSSNTSKGCYSQMFSGCKNLTKINEVKNFNAQYMYQSCFSQMFQNCILLQYFPRINGTFYSNDSCFGMFSGCTSLKEVQNYDGNDFNLSFSINGTADYVFSSMFQGCSNLGMTFNLPTTELSVGCYRDMFKNSGLTVVPELPSTKLYDECYYGMFQGSKVSLEEYTLPATELFRDCYSRMFCNCVELKRTPVLPSLTLVDSCYNEMFKGCSNLMQIHVNFEKWLEGATDNWVEGVGEGKERTFYRNEKLNVIARDSTVDMIKYLYSSSHIPQYWTIEPQIKIVEQVLCYFTTKEGVVENYSDNYFWHEGDVLSGVDFIDKVVFIYNDEDNTDKLYKNFSNILYFVNDEYLGIESQNSKTVKVDLNTLDFVNNNYKLFIGQQILIDNKDYIDIEGDNTIYTKFFTESESYSIKDGVLVYNKIVGEQEEFIYSIEKLEKPIKLTNKTVDNLGVYNIPTKYDRDFNTVPVYIKQGEEFVQITDKLECQIYNLQKDDSVSDIQYVVGNNSECYEYIRTNEGNYVYNVEFVSDKEVCWFINGEFHYSSNSKETTDNRIVYDIPLIVSQINYSIKEQNNITKQVIETESGLLKYNIPINVKEITYYLEGVGNTTSQIVQDMYGNLYYNIPYVQGVTLTYDVDGETFTSEYSIETIDGNYVYDISVYLEELSYIVDEYESSSNSCVKTLDNTYVYDIDAIYSSMINFVIVESRGVSSKIIGNENNGEFYEITTLKDQYGNLFNVSYIINDSLNVCSESIVLSFYNIPVYIDLNGNVEQIEYFFEGEENEWIDVTSEVTSQLLSSIRADFTFYGRTQGQLQLKKIDESQYE